MYLHSVLFFNANSTVMYSCWLDLPVLVIWEFTNIYIYIYTFCTVFPCKSKSNGNCCHMNQARSILIYRLPWLLITLRFWTLLGSMMKIILCGLFTWKLTLSFIVLPWSWPMFSKRNEINLLTKLACHIVQQHICHYRGSSWHWLSQT